ncbi:hypothetical protein ACJRO7_018821 [Eucalyptus globulus]|uniref:Uncharacterized protein n=1 Tax=Eucalyptus globulus TaxID=34317 RepID=A0ABD3KW31_EUCGL
MLKTIKGQAPLRHHQSDGLEVEIDWVDDNLSGGDCKGNESDAHSFRKRPLKGNVPRVHMYSPHSKPTRLRADRGKLKGKSNLWKARLEMASSERREHDWE